MCSRNPHYTPCTTSMGAFLQILLLYCAIQGGRGTADGGRPLVDTKYGKLQGTTLSVKETDRTVDVFYGIPFAKPPVGRLRFAAPESPEPWKTVREATEHPPMCLQPMEQTRKLFENMGMADIHLPVSEDCLFLNVFTPSDRGDNAKLPVMVFIHGGGLVMGAASLYDGSALSAYEDVVYVAIQYRLGILGFLSTGDGQAASGNYGLMDQVEALRWVQENIEVFGGDPGSVTIFGESAGGVSVSALVLSPLAKGLFHRAIAESGVATMPGLMTSSTEELLFHRDFVANESGCEPTSLVDCLKKKSEQEMSTIVNTSKFVPIPACVDGVFLPKPAEEILAAKENNKVPFIVGVNEMEFGFVIPKCLGVEILDGLPKESLQLELSRSLFLGPASQLDYTMFDDYFRDTDDPFEIRNSFQELLGDFMFVMPTLQTAKLHRDSGPPVYFYQLRRRPSLFKDIKPQRVKADHGDELIFVFGTPFLRDGTFFRPHNFPAEEKTLSKTVMRYWANFARTGNPNGPGLALWPQYDQDEDYLQIDIQQKAAQRLKEKKYNFWSKIVPEKIQKMSEETGEHTEL